MTTRLYYSDSNLLEFEASIVSTGKHEELHYTQLDRSAFYPTSGGQLHDTGRLNDIEIIDVIEQPDGEVWHLSHEPVGRAGDTVSGIVDRVRRRRHRQQHTAQHILSQSLVKLYNLATVSVHLGEEYGAIEVDGDEISSDQLREVQSHARKMVEDNLPVEILTVDADEANSIPLRRESKRTGRLRVIKIGEVDWSACGGTHCHTTAEVGLIKVVGSEKIRGHALIKFLAGSQVADDYDTRFEVSDSLSRTLTCHVTDLPERFQKMQQESRALKIELARVQKEVLPVKAKQLAASAEPIGQTRLVFERILDYDKKLVGALASEVAEICGGVAVIYLDGRLIISTSESSGVDAREITAKLTEKAGLKGGGKPRQAQLGGADWERKDDYRLIVLGVLGDE